MTRAFSLASWNAPGTDRGRLSPPAPRGEGVAGRRSARRRVPHAFRRFPDERLRWNDFELGYRSVQEWLECLEELALEPTDAALAREEVAQRYEPRWETGWGTRKLRSLPFRAKADVGRLSLHIGRAAIGEVVFGRR